MEGVTSCHVKVVARFRPGTESAGAGVTPDVSAADTNRISLTKTTGGATAVGVGKTNFSFDSVLGPTSTQTDVFELVGKPAVEDVLNGYNSTIFAYGQTGSGKTYTMYGPGDPGMVDQKDRGIIPRATSYLFEKIQQAADEALEAESSDYVIKCSCIEIYNETVRDLLNPGSDEPVRIRETERKGVWMENVSALFAASEEDVLRIVKAGAQGRATSKTDMNHRSSRSHCVFILHLQQILADGSSKMSQLNLVDLAGSERVNKSGATGQTLQEARSINQSLSALGNCIHALTEPGRTHIPYRDSRLTHLLKESIGGNTKTVLIITGTLTGTNKEETLSTLRFGTRAKTIKNSVKVNKELSREELKLKVETLVKYVQVLEKENGQLKKKLRMHTGVPRQMRRQKSLGVGGSRSPRAKARGLVAPKDDDAGTGTGTGTAATIGAPTTTTVPPPTTGDDRPLAGVDLTQLGSAAGAAALSAVPRDLTATPSAESAASTSLGAGSLSGRFTPDDDRGSVISAVQDSRMEEFVQMRMNLDHFREQLTELEADLDAERAMRQVAEAEAYGLRLEAEAASCASSRAQSVEDKLRLTQIKLGDAMRAASEAELVASQEALASRKARKEVALLEAQLRAIRATTPPVKRNGSAMSATSASSASTGSGPTPPPLAPEEPPKVPEKLQSLRQLSAHLRNRRIALEKSLSKSTDVGGDGKPTGDVDDSKVQPPGLPPAAPGVDTNPGFDSNGDKQLEQAVDRISRQAERIRHLETELKRVSTPHLGRSSIVTPRQSMPSYFDEPEAEPRVDQGLVNMIAEQHHIVKPVKLTPRRPNKPKPRA